MRTRSAMLVALSCLLAAPAFAADPVAQAKQVVVQLSKRDFAGVVKNFDATMTKALPADKLGQVWDGVIQQAGAFKSQLKTSAEKVNQGGQQFDLVSITCQFEKANLNVRVVYNTAGKVAGLFFMPAGS